MTRPDPNAAQQDALLASPDELDRLLHIPSPKNWLILFGFLILALSVVAWGVWGRIPETVSGSGILIRKGGIFQVVSAAQGRVDRLMVTPGDTINNGQLIGHLIQSDGTTPDSIRRIPITSHFSGKVLEILVSEGNYIQKGTPVISIEKLSDGQDALQAQLFFPPRDGQKINVGMAVHVAPATVHTEEDGYILGKVAYVAEFPSTQRGILSIFNNPSLVNKLTQGQAPIKIIVDLEQSDATQSGLKWTTPDGPNRTIQNGTLCDAVIVLKEHRPMFFVFPQLSDWIGRK